MANITYHWPALRLFAVIAEQLLAGADRSERIRDGHRDSQDCLHFGVGRSHIFNFQATGRVVMTVVDRCLVWNWWPVREWIENIDGPSSKVVRLRTLLAFIPQHRSVQDPDKLIMAWEPKGIWIGTQLQDLRPFLVRYSRVCNFPVKLAEPYA